MLLGSLDGCTSLVNLKLEGNFCVQAPDFKLPNLKLLILEYIEFMDSDSVESLFNACLVLEQLILKYCDFRFVASLRICLPLLKGLIIAGCHYESECDFVF
ncbi:hypothetical protein ACH5RR_037910 [Cinchona calisaya]|uniref:F-box/LRR-repeat protein 15/At3g58940/PEG3-like LRR domain-containing protein n=1 Tax=Cinchona calisaya TaxID=153742 RepID=A0ABD2Y8X0_9GENT